MKTRGDLHGKNNTSEEPTSSEVQYYNEENYFPEEHCFPEELIRSEERELSEELLSTEKLRRSELHLEQSINSWITNSSTGSLNAYHSDAHAKRELNVLPFHMYIIKCITLSHYSLRAINTLYNPHCKGTGIS